MIVIGVNYSELSPTLCDLLCCSKWAVCSLPSAYGLCELSIYLTAKALTNPNKNLLSNPLLSKSYSLSST